MLKKVNVIGLKRIIFIHFLSITTKIYQSFDQGRILIFNQSSWIKNILNPKNKTK